MKGCFGIAIAFEPQSQTCIECKDNRGCAERSLESLQVIQQQTDVTDFIEDIKRCGIDATIQPSTNILPRQHKGIKRAKRKKGAAITFDLTMLSSSSRKIATKMLELEENPIQAAYEHRNPFCGIKPSYLENMFELAMAGRFTREQALQTLQETNPLWTPNTLRSHYSSVINALVGLSVIEDCGKFFALKELQ